MNRTAKYFFIAAFFLTAALSYAEKISFSADSMTGTAGSKNSSTTLSGNAAVITETMQINADNIKLSGQDFRYITAEAHRTGTKVSDAGGHSGKAGRGKEHGVCSLGKAI